MLLKKKDFTVLFLWPPGAGRCLACEMSAVWMGRICSIFLSFFSLVKTVTVKHNLFGGGWGGLALHVVDYLVY